MTTTLNLNEAIHFAVINQYGNWTKGALGPDQLEVLTMSHLSP